MRKVQRNAVGVMLLSVVFACLISFVKPTTLLGRVEEDFGGIPMQMGDWVGYDLDSKQFARLLPNSSILVRDYVNGYGHVANVSIVYGLDIADIHNPEYCFEGQGWGAVNKRTVTMISPSGRPYPAKMLQLKETNGGHTVCMYWYAAADGFRDTVAGQRINVWKHAVMTRQVRPSALVRILVPVTTSLDAAEQEAVWLAWTLDEPLRQVVSREPTIIRARRTIGE